MQAQPLSLYFQLLGFVSLDHLSAYGGLARAVSLSAIPKISLLLMCYTSSQRVPPQDISLSGVNASKKHSRTYIFSATNRQGGEAHFIYFFLRLDIDEPKIYMYAGTEV